MSKFSPVADAEEAVGDAGDFGIEFHGGELQLRHRLVQVPGRPAAAETDDRGLSSSAGNSQRRADHRLGVLHRQVEFVVRIDDRLDVAEPLGAEGQQVVPFGWR
jgi:hypothetical protein